MKRLLIVATSVAWLGTGIASCGKAAPADQPAPSAPAAASTASPAPGSSPAATPQVAQIAASPIPGQTTAVDPGLLVALLPDVRGWTRSQSRGERAEAGVPLSMAHAEYASGDSTIKLEITDSTFEQLLMAPLSVMLVKTYSERWQDGYKKYAAIAGQPGFESWQGDLKDGEVTVVVAHRFIVNARGSGVPSIDPVRSIVQAIDFSRLERLK